MSATKSKASKITGIFTAILLVVFVAVAGVTTFSITNIASVVEANILANKNGVPEAWNNYSEKSSVQSEVSSHTINDDYVEYVTSLKNNSETESLSVTHLASYINGNENNGFIPLDSDSLEYTYNPDDINSWTPVDISEPSSNSNEGSKLENNLYVGTAGSNTDTIYFRYNVDMTTDDGLVDDVVAYVTETKSGDTSITTSSTTTEYNPLGTVTSTAEEDLALAKGLGLAQDSATDTDESGEYTQPLGALSEAPDANIISLSRLGAISISKDSLTTSVIVIFAAVGVFIVGLAAYLIFRHHASAKKH
ncbi:hypothetical protein IKF40_01045 [Candidatus Saccharibacteria bacterium]|nr:hypothetical protein [Candidatus Saccharibacteria bacterium]